MNRVYVGTADTYEVSAYGFDGDLELLIRLIRPNVRLTQLEIDQYIDDEVRRATSDNERRRLRWVYGDMDFPEHLPPYSAFVADADGLLWIQDYPRSGAVEVTWRVFEASGVYVASVKTPNRLRVFEIGGDYVLGLWKDELDVEHVRLYALIKPGQ
jgi:hypothetical protein